MPGAPIPLTVIGGYLGSGKTTLVNHLLRHAGGRRLSVLVNDFGQLDVDADLIRAVHGDTISLANGCICCAVGDQLMSTLMQIGRRGDPPDQLVIETSGIADPARVAQIGMAGRRFALSGVVVLADALEVRARRTDSHVGETVRRQLAAADLLLVNKTDLLDAEALAELHAWLDTHAPGPRRIDCAHAAVPPDLVLGQAAGAAPPQPAAAPEAADAGHGLATLTLELAAPPTRAALRRRLETLPDGILRVKGVVHCADTHEPCRVDRVGRRVALSDAPSDVDRAQLNRLVLIGTTDAIASVQAADIER